MAVLCPLFYYHQKHPLNYLLLGIFTVSLAFVVGLTCAFTSGKRFNFIFQVGSAIICLGIVNTLVSDMGFLCLCYASYPFRFLGSY